MKIVIAGLAKSGTTALFFKIKNSLPESTVCFFEPGKDEYIHEKHGCHALVKTLFNRSNTDLDRFKDFEKKVLIIRDPRDRLISGLLYSAVTPKHLLFYKNKELFTKFVRLVKKKQKDPKSVPVLEMVKVRRMHNIKSEKKWNKWYGKGVYCCFEIQKKYPDYFVLKYEDFIDGRLAGLEEYLGFPLTGEADVGEAHSRVVRTCGYGSWKEWFLDSDIEYFRPIFDEFLTEYKYQRDWRISEEQRILPEHSTEYIHRIVSTEKERLENQMGPR